MTGHDWSRTEWFNPGLAAPQWKKQSVTVNKPGLVQNGTPVLNLRPDSYFMHLYKSLG